MIDMDEARAVKIAAEMSEAMPYFQFTGLHELWNALRRPMSPERAVVPHEIFRRWGDTHYETTFVEYMKHLERLGFEQFADYPMPNHAGRTLAFVRVNGLAVATLVVEKGGGTHMRVTMRSGAIDGGWKSLQFSDEYCSVEGKTAETFHYSFSGLGMHLKLFCADTMTPVMDRWWGLRDDGTKLYRERLEDVLVTYWDRFRARDYHEVSEMAEDRLAAVPKHLRELLDADMKYRLSDIMPSAIVGCRPAM